MRSTRRHPLPVVAVVSLLALIGGACGGSGSGSTKVDSRAPLAEPDDLVEITDRGAEPRHEMRFEFNEGVSSPFSMSMGMNMEMSIEGLGDQQIDTTVTMDGSTTVDEVLDDGSAKIRFVYEEVGVDADGQDPAAAEQMDAMLQEMAGLEGATTVTARGQWGDVDFDTSDITNEALLAQIEQLSDQLRNLTIPFPDQAVGKGATWAATSEATLNGISTSITNTYRLLEVDEDSYRFEVEQAQSAKPGPVELPGVPGDADVTLVSMRGNGEGTTGGPYDQLVGSGKMSSEAEVEMKIAADGEEGTMRLRMELEVDIRGG